jgi:hypothetical protein
MVKTCSRCTRSLPLDLFSPNPRGRMGRQSMCVECVGIRRRQLADRPQRCDASPVRYERDTNGELVRVAR